MNDIWQEVYKSTLKFLVPLETKQTYMVIAKEALRLVGGGYASIFLFQGGELKRVYTTNKELEGIIPRQEGITYEVFRTRVPHLRHKDGLVSANNKFSDMLVQSNITIPLNFGHLSLGVLSIISKKGTTLTEEGLRALSLFGPFATLAIRKTQLLQEAEQAVAARNLLISLADHEVKNYLTTILLNLEDLKRSSTIKKTEEYKYVKRLDRSVNAIRNIVDEFLRSDRLKFANFKYNFANENIVLLCKQTVNDFAAEYKTHTFSFTNMSDKNEIMVRCDKEKIKQVLVNLMNNAMKFSPPNSNVEISLELNEKVVIIEVSDQGLGISKKDLSKVFKKYYRGRTHEKGMGLGLYLVREIIKRHNGIVKIISEVNKGTKVGFSLPLF
jgi:signal transduction histidine kinase